MILGKPAKTRTLPEDYLQDAANEWQSAKERRLKSYMYAKQAGYTNNEIGAAYGITGEAVRQALKGQEGSNGTR